MWRGEERGTGGLEMNSKRLVLGGTGVGGAGQKVGGKDKYRRSNRKYGGVKWVKA